MRVTNLVTRIEPKTDVSETLESDMEQSEILLRRTIKEQKREVKDSEMVCLSHALLLFA